jgi:Flp pilus assembly protein TadG
MHMRFSNRLGGAPESGSYSRRRKRETGSVLMMFTLLVPFVLIPIVGLGIDATMLYTVKVKLQTAVDGAALAAAESLSAGLTVAAQQSAASLAADEFIRANIVTGASAGHGGYWGSYNLNDDNCTGSTTTTAGTPTGSGSQITYASSGDCIVIYQDDTNKQRTVSLAASVTVPLLFMRILGFSNGTVTARGTAARRDVVMVLVIDRSGSMGAELGAVQQGATYFVNQFSAGRDKLGLVLISGSAYVAYPPADLGTNPPTGATGPDVNFNGTTETPNMITTINNMISGSNTGTAEGLMLAWKELQAANEPGALNIIVLWTDGAPNGITADFNNSSTSSLKSGSGCAHTNDGTNGLYPNAVATNSMLGWMAQWGGYAYNSNATNGIRQRTQTNSIGFSVTQWAELCNPGTDAPAGKCQSSNEAVLSNTSGSGNGCAWGDGSAVSSVINIPSADYYGNSTQGSPVAPYRQSDYKQSMIWTTTTANCQQGRGGTGGVPLTLTGTLSGGLAASGNACQVGLASWNATDMAARQIHFDTTLTPIIYTMGYAGSVAGSGGVDTVLLERLANCAPGVPCSPGGANATNTVYNSTIPSGMYIQIQTVNDVAPAFQVLLSEILRLSM